MVLEIKVGEVVSENTLVREGFRKVPATESLGREGAIIYKLGSEVYVTCPTNNGSLMINAYENLDEGSRPLGR